MYEPLSQFIASLRASGITISIAEELDCLQALHYCPFFDKLSFFNHLRLTLIKSHHQYSLFKRIFDLFFFGQHDKSSHKIAPHLTQTNTGFMLVAKSPHPLSKSITKGLKSPEISHRNIEKIEVLSEAERDSLKPLLESLPLSLGGRDEFLNKFFTGTKRELKHLAFKLAQKRQNAALNPPNTLQSQRTSHASNRRHSSSALTFGNSPSTKKKNSLWGMLHLQLSKILFQIAPSLKNETQLKIITQLLLDNLEYFKRAYSLALYLSSLNLRHQFTPVSCSPNTLAYEQTPLFNLDIAHSKELQDVIERLVLQIATRASLRHHQALHGQIDFKKTIRKSLKYLGHPIILEYKKRRIIKPDIVILCDVSGSVKYAVRFFLLFLSHLTIAFSRVECFLFVSLIDKIHINSSLRDFEEINHAFQHATIDHRGYSDFGAAFSSFDELYGRILTHKTTMIILGDARNNHRASRTDILASWKTRVNKLLWFNPEPMSEWNTGDSILLDYAEHCDVVAQCSTLSDLVQLIEKTLLI